MVVVVVVVAIQVSRYTPSEKIVALLVVIVVVVVIVDISVVVSVIVAVDTEYAVYNQIVDAKCLCIFINYIRTPYN